MHEHIMIEPGCLDHVPLRSLAVFLAQQDLELVYKPDGLRIRRATRHSLSVIDLTEGDLGCDA